MLRNQFLLKFFQFSLMFILALLHINSAFSQNNNPGINFQAIARDKEHNAANNRKLYIECTIEN